MGKTSLAEALLELPMATDDEVARLVPPPRVHLTATPPSRSAGEPAPHPVGVDTMRAALLHVALEGVDVSIERTRKAKRPYATAIVGGAALATAAEGLLPGAAAWVVATQFGAITGLYYLYTGKWMARSQALALLPVFASAGRTRSSGTTSCGG